VRGKLVCRDGRDGAESRRSNGDRSKVGSDRGWRRNNRSADRRWFDRSGRRSWGCRGQLVCKSISSAMARSEVGIISYDETPTVATIFGYNLVLVGDGIFGRVGDLSSVGK